jgi:hypothetical protein
VEDYIPKYLDLSQLSPSILKHNPASDQKRLPLLTHALGETTAAKETVQQGTENGY